MICSYYLLTPNSTCSINVITVIRGCHDEQLGNELLGIVGTIQLQFIATQYFFISYTFFSIEMKNLIF